VTLLISAIPNLDADGCYRGASCVVTDISQRKAAEDALLAERTLLSQRIAERTASLQRANEELARELTERQQAEEALRAAEVEYRLLFNHVPMGLYRASLDGRQLRANPALVRLHGFTSESELLALLQNGEIDWYAEPGRRAELLRLLYEQGNVVNFESEVLHHQTGERFWISESAVIVRDSAGTPLYYQGTVEDITARKAVALQQERLIAELARVAQMKDEFLANISHELRTPLNGILNLTELLCEQIYGTLNSRQQQALRTIDECAQHLLSLINDILDLAKLEANGAELVLAPVALDELCQAAMRFVGPGAQKKRLRVYFTPDPAVRELVADEMRLKQVLINLLDNAVKFTPERGAIGLEVKARWEQEPLVDLVVWDTGLGIPAAAQEEVFRPFVQGDSRLARQHGGTGLGLALVRRMVELHGGAVTLESQVDRGSRFTVTLPWQQSAAQGQPLAEAPDQPAARPREAAHKKTGADAPLVLLVSQDATTLHLIDDYLRFKGYEVAVVTTAADLAGHTPAHPPAAIILDVQPRDLQPRLDEDEHPATLLRANPHLSAIPIILLTPHEGYEPVTTSPVDAALKKPIRLQELAQLIGTTITANGLPQATPEVLDNCQL
jgi:PAS domain S-box-containing protein